MTLHDYLVPIAMAVSAVPILVSAVLVARGNLHLINGLDASRLPDPARTAAKLARLLATTGVAMLLGGAGFYWAGDNEGRIALVVVALLLAVNGLAVALILAIGAARRSYRDRPGGGEGTRRR
ncbi:hypothetical protein [Lysobacter sp. ESA13C]|uniref:hypothetical protein n=1 Tax=Lysobacter sp. ESA13C TaxID=2862676 RepID=UPI001CBCA454|nr:hypothetical protein [Lysobacter sp. ESA13C]